MKAAFPNGQQQAGKDFFLGPLVKVKGIVY